MLTDMLLSILFCIWFLLTLGDCLDNSLNFIGNTFWKWFALSSFLGLRLSDHPSCLLGFVLKVGLESSLPVSSLISITTHQTSYHCIFYFILGLAFFSPIQLLWLYPELRDYRVVKNNSRKVMNIFNMPSASYFPHNLWDELGWENLFYVNFFQVYMSDHLKTALGIL